MSIPVWLIKAHSHVVKLTMATAATAVVVVVVVEVETGRGMEVGITPDLKS